MSSHRIMIVVGTLLGISALAANAFSQLKSLKEQLLGAWHLVSIDYVRADGGRSTTFGDNPLERDEPEAHIHSLGGRAQADEPRSVDRGRND